MTSIATRRPRARGARGIRPFPFCLLLGFGVFWSASGAPNPDEAPPPRPVAQVNLLFKSGFEGDVVFGRPVMHGNGAWQDISGTDSETGFEWPPKLFGGATSRFQLIAGERENVKSAADLREYMYNEIQTVPGRDGKPTRALYSAVLKSARGKSKNFDATQNVFHLLPGAPQGDLYLSYWLKLQPDLLERMTEEKWAGRVITDWKTGGDYRIFLSVFGDRRGKRLYWNLRGDNVANGGLPPKIFWNLDNDQMVVPVGEWFRVETFVRRGDDAEGRVWVAVNGRTLFDRRGANLGVNKLPWNRVMLFLNYSTGQSLPAYQWVDDVEIWDGFPPHALPTK